MNAYQAEIGRGAQYQVVQINADRVRKIPLTPEESQRVVLGFSPEDIVQARTIDYTQLAVDGVTHVRRTLEAKPELRSTFGNPDFEYGAQYTQDYMPLFGNAVRGATVEQGRLLVEQYIALQHNLWRHGIGDYIFKCAANNGVDIFGRVVLLDFGEITTDIGFMTKSLEQKSWLASNSYKNRLPDQLKSFYSKRMEAELTPTLLHELWQSAI